MNETPAQPRKMLRTVIGVVLIAGMAVGYGAMGQQRAGKRTTAIDALRQSGGRVYLDYQWRDGAPVTRPKPPPDSLARRVLGSAWLDRVVAVDLTQVDDMDQAVRCLRWLPDLEYLNATGTAIGDQQIELLGRITSLRSLRLAETGITDASVPHLDNLRLLRQLDVRKTNVTATGAKRLRAALPRCEVVH